METNTPNNQTDDKSVDGKPTPLPPKVSETDLLIQIYENTRKTKNYMMWQLYITLILVVLPLLAMVFIVPYVFKTLSSVYGSAGLMQ